MNFFLKKGLRFQNIGWVSEPKLPTMWVEVKIIDRSVRRGFHLVKLFGNTDFFSHLYYYEIQEVTLLIPFNICCVPTMKEMFYKMHN